MAAIAAKLLIAMNDSSRRPRSPYPGLVASAEVRSSLLIGPLVPPRLLSLRCCQRRQPSDLILGQTVFSRHGLALNKTGVRQPQNPMHAAPLEAYATRPLNSLRILPSSRSNSTGLVSNSSHRPRAPSRARRQAHGPTGR